LLENIKLIYENIEIFDTIASMDILLTNDDGYSSIGFYPLLEKLSKKFKVSAIAPNAQKSWVGKSITAHAKFELGSAKAGKFIINTIEGTPADCVQIGLYHLLKNPPKLVISGINIGENIGHGRILSSGTIGAAMEAAIDGVRSIASSLCIPHDVQKHINFFDKKNYYIFEDAAKITFKLAEMLINAKLDKQIDVISINIPYGATIDSPIEITRPFKEPYGQLFFKQENLLVHANPTIDIKNLKIGTDLKAISEGKISVTPINLDLVSQDSADFLKETIKKNW
jgi:5'-nucleotidase